ncbi:MAG: response regulator [Syntrophobacteraceae bacterium]|jgi:CheY-like chemotaxis protein|nr:response regulator [Syntrophobacteraceae bacterium]
MKSILVIDDEELLVRMVKTMLEREGYRVLVAPNGKHGLKLFREEPVDLVITDIFMPEKEGLETIRELRREFPGIKIIAMSGGMARAEGFSALPLAEKLGANHTLLKPFERAQLLSVVSECLQ